MIRNTRTRIMIGAALVAAGGAIIVLGVFPRIADRLRSQFGDRPLCADQSDAPVTDSGRWERGAPLPTVRGETRMVALNGLIYFVGGLLPEWEVSPAVEVYDPAADSWRAVASLPMGTNHPGLAAYSGRIYVTGGYNAKEFTSIAREGWVYDPDSDIWASIAPMPEPRAAHVMVTIGDRLYVAGGTGPADPSTVWAYDPEADRWDTSLAPLSSFRDHAAGAVVEGKFYLIGGGWEHSGNYAIVEVYDPETDTWERRADMPTPRSGLAADVIGGKIHVAGGENIDVACTYNRHEVYNPATDTWTRSPDLPSGRHGLGAAVLDGRWYVIGGARAAGPNTQYSFVDEVDIFIPGAA